MSFKFNSTNKKAPEIYYEGLFYILSREWASEKWKKNYFLSFFLLLIQCSFYKQNEIFKNAFKRHVIYSILFIEYPLIQQLAHMIAMKFYLQKQKLYKYVARMCASKSYSFCLCHRTFNADHSIFSFFFSFIYFIIRSFVTNKK